MFLGEQRKGWCGVTSTEFWKQSIIEAIGKIDSKVSLMKIYYFVIVFLC